MWIWLLIPVFYLLWSNGRLAKRLGIVEKRLFQLLEARALGGTVSKDQVEQDEKPAKGKAGAEKSGLWPKKNTAAAVATDVGRADPIAASALPRSVVFNLQRARALFDWIKENWFYAVSALSLALAAVFLVQYGNEQGLLPPIARVWGAVIFGAVLIGAGEFIRRRYGDDSAGATAYLAPTFSGAGIVALFAGVLSARIMYGLIGPEFTMIALVVIAVLAIVLGWFYGPFLAAIGVIGAMASPFLVGGESDAPEMLFGYFALVAIVGLSIDTLRRWAWISVLSLILAVGCGVLLRINMDAAVDGSVGLVVMMVLLSLAAMTIPARRIFPDHGGLMMIEAPRAYLASRRTGDKRRWPQFPTFLAAGMAVVANYIIVMVAFEGAMIFWVAVVALMMMFGAFTVLAYKATALADVAMLPAVGVLVLIGGAEYGVVWQAFQAGSERLAEAAMPRAASHLFAIAVLMSALALWRSFRDTDWPHYWGVAGLLIAPVALVVLEVNWHPATVIGVYPWALHAAGLAIAAMLLAERYARRDGEDRLRAAMAVLVTLSMITFGCVVILSSTALTVAIAVTVAAAGLLDRRFNLPLLSVFIQAGVVAIGFRLVVDPGVDWAVRAPVGEVIVAFGVAIGGFIVAYGALRPMVRDATKTMLESAILANIGIVTSLLLNRWVDTVDGGDSVLSHWSLSLNAMIWICVAYAQFYRVRTGGWLRYVRMILGGVFGLVGATLLLLSVTVANPMSGFGSDVVGPIVVNSLMVSYLFPALLLVAGQKYLWPHRRKTAIAIFGVSAALVVLYIGLAIRHFWQGADISDYGSSQAELYSYTVALLVAGALMLYQSIARQSPGLRKAAMFVIAMSVAKVFFVDISGLQGLTRVFSLLALGLSLAGLAWLNRWASGQEETVVVDEDKAET